MEHEEIAQEIKLLKNKIYRQKDKINAFSEESKIALSELREFLKQLNRYDRILHSELKISEHPPRGLNRLLVKKIDSELVSKILKIKNYEIGSYTLNTETRMLTHENSSYSLTRIEMLLLAVFAANLNVLVDRATILEAIWNEVTYLKSRSMDVYMTKLRKFLKDDPNINLINKHGAGYVLWIRK